MKLPPWNLAFTGQVVQGTSFWGYCQSINWNLGGPKVRQTLRTCNTHILYIVGQSETALKITVLKVLENNLS